MNLTRLEIAELAFHNCGSRRPNTYWIASENSARVLLEKQIEDRHTLGGTLSSCFKRSCYRGACVAFIVRCVTFALSPLEFLFATTLCSAITRAFPVGPGGWH